MLVSQSPPTMLDLRKYTRNIIILCFLVQNVKATARIDPLVETKLGLIRGVKSDDGSYAMFMGIPYATVDQSNPFGPSIPHGPFNGTFEAYDDSAICPQVEEFYNTITGTLDCLHINIYVPDTASSVNPLPVMTMIYGGGFRIGFSGRYIYGPKFFVRHDVILVTLNYRLGPYGFMCLDSPKVPGNQGLKDQQLALRWIKENIDAFGGDPNSITIFGESAGGASVDLQLMYNHERPFDKVILQSGTAQAHWPVQEPDATAPLKLAAHLGLETLDIDEALTFLSSVNTDSVIGASTELGLTFKGCVEKQFDNVEIFIDVHPFNVQLSDVQNVPVLLGYTNDEYRSFLNDVVIDMGKGLSLPEDLIFNELLTEEFDFNDQRKTEMLNLVKHFYIGDEELTLDNVWKVMNFGSDMYFTHPIERAIEMYQTYGVKNLYYYMFSYTGGRSFVRLRSNITVGGAVHADELGYQFDISYMNEPTGQDQITVDRLSSFWTNFAKYGNPTPSTSELIPIIWEPVTKENLYYMNIDTDLTLGRRPNHERMAFWNVFYAMNQNYRRGYVSENDSQ